MGKCPWVWLAGAQEAAFALTIWLGGIVLTVLAALVVLIYVRKRLQAARALEDRGFSVDDISAMRERGDVSVEEYKALRRSAIGLDTKRSSVRGEGSPDNQF